MSARLFEWMARSSASIIRGGTRFFFRTIPLPHHFPYLNSFVCGDEGRIFVKTLENQSSGRIRYNVFISDGIYIAGFEHPENEEILSIKKNRA